LFKFLDVKVLQQWLLTNYMLPNGSFFILKSNIQGVPFFKGMIERSEVGVSKKYKNKKPFLRLERKKGSKKSN